MAYIKVKLKKHKTQKNKTPQGSMEGNMFGVLCKGFM